MENEHDLEKAEADLAAAERDLKKAEAEVEHAEAEVAEALAHDHDVKIIVNGRQRTIDEHVISFEELVKIAFPNGPTKPNTRFTITYRNADQVPTAGELDAGQTVKVRTKGETIFNVTETVQS